MKIVANGQVHEFLIYGNNNKTMNENERLQLQQELKEVTDRINNAEFIDPKDLRRKDKINSMLLTGDLNADVKWKITNGKESQRVTSFTRDRR